MSPQLPASPREHQPVAWPALVKPASLTYEPFYGLKEKPFSLSADPKFLFKSPSHTPAFERLLAGIRRREGLIVLTGEIGTGKTTLCRAVLQHLDRRTFSTFVPDPFVSREDLLRMLLVDFGVMSIDDVKSGRMRGASRAELSYPLYEFLNSLVPLQAYAVLVIDEAQNLSPALLEEIRILADLEGREKLLQVVLVGQPELRDCLKRPEMRQVDQRVSVRCELLPIGRIELDGYVAHRLHVANGGTCDGVEFTPDALDVVYRASGGTPRLINRICDRSLHEAHLRRARRVEVDVVTSALEDLELPLAAVSVAAGAARHADEEAVAEFSSEEPSPSTPRSHLRWLVIAVLAVLAAAMAALSLLPRPETSAIEISSPRVPLHPRLQMTRALPLPEPPADAAGATVATVTDVRARFIIQVASFESDVRAARLVARLEAAGFRAYHTQVDVDGDDSWWQVSVGPYPSAVAAETDLDQIRLIPGYEDAALRTLVRNR
jgi:type II secretory pathway predicted ATPase ExeA/cell division septation protein DedD